MRRFAPAILLALVALYAAPASAAAAKLVYKVDQVTAKIESRKLVITVTGAVRSGGWLRPRLRVKQPWIPESDTVVVEFVATPPSERAMVIQAILPVDAKLSAPLPHYGAVQVKVVAETNSVTAPIDIASPTNATTKAIGPHRLR
jgi:hypothetical protein